MQVIIFYHKNYIWVFKKETQKNGLGLSSFESRVSTKNIGKKKKKQRERRLPKTNINQLKRKIEKHPQRTYQRKTKV